MLHLLSDAEWPCCLMQLQHQEQAQEELTNGRKRRAEESTSLFDWFWDSGDLPEGNEPISDLIKDELWTNPMRGSSDGVQVPIFIAVMLSTHVSKLSWHWVCCLFNWAVAHTVLLGCIVSYGSSVSVCLQSEVVCFPY